MFPMWLVLVPLPGTRPVCALLLTLYFDALYSPGDSVAGPRIIRNVGVELLRFARTRPSRTAQRGRGAAPAPAASAGSDPHWLQWFNGPRTKIPIETNVTPPFRLIIYAYPARGRARLNRHVSASRTIDTLDYGVRARGTGERAETEPDHRPPARPPARAKGTARPAARAAEGIRLDHFLFTECT